MGVALVVPCRYAWDMALAAEAPQENLAPNCGFGAMFDTLCICCKNKRNSGADVLASTAMLCWKLKDAASRLPYSYIEFHLFEFFGADAGDLQEVFGRLEFAVRVAVGEDSVCHGGADAVDALKLL